VPQRTVMPSFSRVKWTNSPTTQQHILEDWNHQIFNLLDFALHRNMYHPEISLQNWTVTHRIMMCLLAHKASEEMLAISAELWHLHQQRQRTSKKYSNYCCVHSNSSAVMLPRHLEFLDRDWGHGKWNWSTLSLWQNPQNRSLHVWGREIMVATYCVIQ
jgi:hypothetical protein